MVRRRNFYRAFKRVRQECDGKRAALTLGLFWATFERIQIKRIVDIIR